MNSYSEADLEVYKRAKSKSVNSDGREAELRKIAYKKGYEKGTNKGLKTGIKSGIVIGAVATILVSTGISMVSNAFNNNYVNDSYNYGYKAVISETHRTNDNEHYWYDYIDIASSFDAETMDFDSFVYGTYAKVGWSEESRIDCMNDLFYNFKRLGFTNYSSFVSYCDSKGFCKEKDGKLVVDTHAFEKAIEEYMSNLNEIEEKEKSCEGFRNGL